MFNALKYIEKLERSGIPRNHAEAQVQMVYDSMENEFASKNSVSVLGSELRGEMVALRGELRGDMANLRAEMKSDMANLRAEMKSDMATLKSDLVGVIIGTGGGVVGLISLVLCIVGWLIKTG